MYKVHFLAFPIGMIFAVILSNPQKILSLLSLSKPLHTFFKTALILLLSWVISYTAIHSGIGESLKVEHYTSLITTIAVIFWCLLLPIKSEFLMLMGIYSYEIYLIHWPIISRHDFLYKNLPPFLATLVYLLFFLGVSMIANKLGKYLTTAVSNRR